MINNLFLQDLTQAKTSLIIIPHSTDGFMQEGLRSYLDSLGISNMISAKSELGNLKVITLQKNSEPTTILLACTNDGFYSSYALIRKIFIGILAYADSKDKPQTISVPLLGSGGGGLDPKKVYFLLDRVLSEHNSRTHTVRFCLLEPVTFDNIKAKQSPNLNLKSANLAFEYCLDDLKKERWFTELISEPDFYFRLAVEKFNEFAIFRHEETDFFMRLEKKFHNSEAVFQDFIKDSRHSADEAKFLTLCGELVSYIDRHAYNKQEWNRYIDKRTMALSSVNQTNWINNLLKYRAVLNDISKVSPSIKNALKFLIEPESELMMLSETHRALVCEKILYQNYKKASFVEQLKAYISALLNESIHILNAQNITVLYTRILYSPPIKALWEMPKIEVKVPTHNTIENKSSFSIDAQAEETSSANKISDAHQINKLDALIHSDNYAKVDMLGYEAYASVIAAFLTSRHTTPPLTIGILAPWGKGKTTLMRFIAEKIKGKVLEENPVGQEKVKERPKASRYNLFNWVKSGKELISIDRLSHPIVWFNAWKFQKSEQIWAGLANEIIKQLAENLTDLDREKFYLRLNLKRIDKDKIRQEIITHALSKLLIPGVLAILIFVTGLFIRLIPKNHLPIPIDLPEIAITSILGFILSAIYFVKDYLGKSPGADLSKYMLQPDYKNKMGYYSAVEEDLKHALDILVDIEKPPVIFIDDLDRCAPGTISELIEAINLFISGDMSTCYFVIGQDAQIVAAALEASYEKMGQKLHNIEKNHGSIGWYFMEKFIQLQFNIPVVTNEQSFDILSNLLNMQNAEKLISEAKQSELLSEYAECERSAKTIDDLEQIFTERLSELEEQIICFAPERIVNFRNMIIERAIKEFKVEESALEEVIKSVAPHVKNSPRIIKRFANLYVFYQFMKYSNSCKGLRLVNETTIGRWVLIMIRWPQLIRAIQWDSEKGFLEGDTAKLRADSFEALIQSCQDYQTWSKLMADKKAVESSWVYDLALYDFFKAETSMESQLGNAVVSGLW